MPYAEVNGQRLLVEDTGGDGPPIVFSHGFLMDHEMFLPQVASLARTHRVITWDQRGFGQTETDGEAFTYWDSARDLFALLDVLGIERAVLAGMSQGGYVSLRAALLQPDRVRALVLIDTQAETEPAEVVPGYRAMIDTWVAEGYREDLASSIAALILGDEVDHEPWKAKWRSWPSARLAAAGGALLDRDSIADRLPEIDAPSLVIHGSRDVSIPLERAERLCAGLVECRGLVVVDGAAHAPNLSHPDVVDAPLREFLEGLPA